MAFQDAGSNFGDGHGDVGISGQPVPGQPLAVELPGFVKAPVLGDAQGGVVVPFLAGIGGRRA